MVTNSFEFIENYLAVIFFRHYFCARFEKCFANYRNNSDFITSRKTDSRQS